MDVRTSIVFLYIEPGKKVALIATHLYGRLYKRNLALHSYTNTKRTQQPVVHEIRIYLGARQQAPNLFTST